MIVFKATSISGTSMTLAKEANGRLVLTREKPENRFNPFTAHMNATEIFSSAYFDGEYLYCDGGWGIPWYRSAPIEADAVELNLLSDGTGDDPGQA